MQRDQAEKARGRGTPNAESYRLFVEEAKMTEVDAAPPPDQMPLVPCNWYVTLKVEEMARHVEFNSWGAKTTLRGNAKTTLGKRFSFVGYREALVEEGINLRLEATDETRAPEKPAIPWTASVNGGGDPFPYWVSIDVEMPIAHLERIYALLLEHAWMSLSVRVDGMLATSPDGKVDVAYLPEASSSHPVTLPAHISRMDFEEGSFTVGGKKPPDEIRVKVPPAKRDIALEITRSLKPVESLLKRQVFVMWMICAIAVSVLILWLRR